MQDRSQLRLKAKQFVEGPDFLAYYQKVHPKAVAYVFGCLLGLVVRPHAFATFLRLLLVSPWQHFHSARLLKKYHKLPEHGHIVRLFVVKANEALQSDRSAIAGALFVSSLTENDAHDQVASDVATKVLTNRILENWPTKEDRVVDRMFEHTNHIILRRRPLPLGYTNGVQLYFVNACIDNHLLNHPQSDGVGPCVISYLIDPSYHGVMLQIPFSDETEQEYDRLVSSHQQKIT